jgi:hypothetical protein
MTASSASQRIHWREHEGLKWVELSRWFGSTAVRGLDGLRMAARGGFLPFPISRPAMPVA